MDSSDVKNVQEQLQAQQLVRTRILIITKKQSMNTGDRRTNQCSCGSQKQELPSKRVCAFLLNDYAQEALALQTSAEEHLQCVGASWQDLQPASHRLASVGTGNLFLLPSCLTLHAACEQKRGRAPLDAKDLP